MTGFSFESMEVVNRSKIDEILDQGGSKEMINLIKQRMQPCRMTKLHPSSSKKSLVNVNVL